MKNTFRNAWNGEERLWKVWWLIGVPLGLLFMREKEMHMPAYPIVIVGGSGRTAAAGARSARS
ncbi:hypothetical protein [Burkholderia sp. Bp8998]|uniref:hypothetical protein n=1 Tax=Burkholderia sp. Bp8998 TaxID=2184557 RepID=UPI000F5AC3F4|nr:hypothetical protein [Burkholderia sp. Bp8998]RQS15813.1 hypothetical protein DIE06_21495 [Burkholderia sp. Bp8998]